jgi:hypothetical protein
MIDLHGAGPWIVFASVLMFVVSLIVLPIVVIYLPHDYFTSRTPRFAYLQNTHPVIRWLVLVVKNLIGGLLVAAGLIMLVTPGQGLLALLVGVMLLDVPGKRTVERRVLHRPALLRMINSIRDKAGRPPLDEDDG